MYRLPKSINNLAQIIWGFRLDINECNQAIYLTSY